MKKCEKAHEKNFVHAMQYQANYGFKLNKLSTISG
jgi:hypothetical protein